MRRCLLLSLSSHHCSDVLQMITLPVLMMPSSFLCKHTHTCTKRETLKASILNSTKVLPLLRYAVTEAPALTNQPSIFFSFFLTAKSIRTGEESRKRQSSRLTPPLSGGCWIYKYESRVYIFIMERAALYFTIALADCKFTH